MTLPILITSDVGSPIYLQIKYQIHYLVTSRQLKEGSLLPSVRSLATQLGINANTVAQAYKELVNDGLVVSRRGQGTFVNTFPWATQDSTFFRNQLLTELLQYTCERAAALGFSNIDLRNHLNAALVHPVKLQLVTVMPNEAAAEKYRRILLDRLGEAYFSIAATTLAGVEGGTADVLDIFKVAYFAITFTPNARRLENALKKHQIVSEVIPATADLTHQVAKDLSKLDADQNILLLTEEHNIASALNIVLENSHLKNTNITLLSPSGDLGARLASCNDLVIYTFGVKDDLVALNIPSQRCFELEFDLSEETLHSIRQRLGLQSIPL